MNGDPRDLRIKRDDLVRVYCDKKSVIKIVHNPIKHDRPKYIEVDRHFIKEKIDNGLMCHLRG